MQDTGGDYRSSTLTKGLTLLRLIIADNSRSSLSDLARAARMPLATAHRLAVTLEAEGFLTRLSKGSYAAGPVLDAATKTEAIDPIASCLRKPLARLAEETGAFVHYGVLEDSMVTYLVREPAHAASLFTAESIQLEAYCSAVGKVLLSALADDELEAYLANGPFVALTSNTITDPNQLRAEIAQVRRERLAYDRHEIREDLFCMAVPVGDAQAGTRGAISMSFVGIVPEKERQSKLLARARRIGVIGLKNSRALLS